MKLRQRVRIASILLGVALGLWCGIGCVSTVRPPNHPEDPVTVHLICAGRHAGLLIPCGDGRSVEYGYGAWSWYALGKDDWWRAPATVLWPSQGTLGRRYVPEQSRGSDEISALLVPRQRVERLLARLDSAFAAGGKPHYNGLYDMEFVRHPARFWFAHDCHDEVADWLREIGCSVSRSAIRIKLRVEASERHE